MGISRQQLRLAFRSFRRHRTFSITAVLSLGLAIALNTTMYGAIDGLVNPPAEVSDPEHLFLLTIYGDAHHRVSPAVRSEMVRSGLRSAEDVAFSEHPGYWPVAVEYQRRYTRAPRVIVSPNLFRVTGTPFVRGRGFNPADPATDAHGVVITDQLAATLSPDRDLPLGAVIAVDGDPYTVIGVVRANPAGGRGLWTLPPLAQLSSFQINVVRLRADVPRARVDAELAVLEARFAELSNGPREGVRFDLRPSVTPQFHVASFHYALIGGVVAILLIACANLANLQLARGIGRTRELALRAALGASRADIVIQLLVESTLLALGGLVLGLLLTWWGAGLLAAHVPPSIANYVVAPQLSWRVLLVAAVATVACVFLVGLLPAIHVSRVDANVLLKSGAGTGAHRRNRWRYGVMVAVEIGLALTVVCGAAIVVRLAHRIARLADRYELEPFSVASITLDSTAGRTRLISELSNQLLSRVRPMPEVAGAETYFTRFPDGSALVATERGGTWHQLAAWTWNYRVVSPGYLRTMQLHILHGRDFPATPPAEPEVAIDRQTARVLWPGVDPVGLQLKLGYYRSNAPWVRVVAVVESPWNDAEDRAAVAASDAGLVRQGLLNYPGDVYYLPGASETISAPRGRMGMTVLARAKSDPERMPVLLRRAFVKMPRLASLGAETMKDQMRVTNIRESHEFVAWMFAAFAALAVGLAAVGVYGIVSHSVEERRRELGVRLALGASAKQIVHAAIRDGNPIALAGVAVGLYATKDSMKWLHAFSADGDEYDVALFAAVAVFLFAVALVAALFPALRATRIDPVESLRHE